MSGVNKTCKTCETCGAWQAMDVSGQCRMKAPTAEGWPWTSENDWCREWIKDERPKPPAKEDFWQVGINYVFVRDYPEQAAAWLAAARVCPEGIPAPLVPVLSDLFGSVLTEALPDWRDNAPCCERLLLWAEQIPGFCNQEDETDDEYQGLLMSMAHEAEIEASKQALAEIPADHPWRSM